MEAAVSPGLTYSLDHSTGSTAHPTNDFFLPVIEYAEVVGILDGEIQRHRRA